VKVQQIFVVEARVAYRTRELRVGTVTAHVRVQARAVRVSFVADRAEISPRFSVHLQMRLIRTLLCELGVAILAGVALVGCMDPHVHGQVTFPLELDPTYVTTKCVYAFALWCRNGLFGRWYITSHYSD